MTIPMLGMSRENNIMSQFTDSPYERLMKQVPEAGKGTEKRRDDKCQGCPYGRGRPCVGICMAQLLNRRKSGKKKG